MKKLRPILSLEIEEMNQAYLNMPKDIKKIFRSVFNKIEPSDFSNFTSKNTLLKGKRKQFIIKKDYFQKAIDDTLIKNNDIFKKIIVHFFKDIKEGAEVNRYFLKEIEAYQETDIVKQKANDIIQELHTIHDNKYPGFINFYDKALRTLQPEYFKEYNNTYQQIEVEEPKHNSINVDNLKTQKGIKCLKDNIQFNSKMPCSLTVVSTLENISKNLKYHLAILTEKRTEEISFDDLNKYNREISQIISHVNKLYKELTKEEQKYKELSTINNNCTYYKNSHCCAIKNNPVNLSIFNFTKYHDNILELNTNLNKQIQIFQDKYRTVANEIKDINLDLNYKEQINSIKEEKSLFILKYKLEYLKKIMLEKKGDQIEIIKCKKEEINALLVKNASKLKHINKTDKLLLDKKNNEFLHVKDIEVFKLDIKRLIGEIKQRASNTHNDKEIANEFLGSNNNLYIYKLVEVMLKEQNYCSGYSLLYLLQKTNSDSDFFILDNAPSPDDFIKLLVNICSKLQPKFKKDFLTLILLQPWINIISKNDIDSLSIRLFISILAGIGKYNNIDDRYSIIFNKFAEVDTLNYVHIKCFIDYLKHNYPFKLINNSCQNESQTTIIKKLNDKFQKEHNVYSNLATKKFSPLAKIEGRYIISKLDNIWSQVKCKCHKKLHQDAKSLLLKIDIDKLYRNGIKNNHKLKKGGTHELFEKALIDNGNEIISYMTSYIDMIESSNKTLDYTINKEKLISEIDTFLKEHINLDLNVNELFKNRENNINIIEYTSFLISKYSYKSIMWFQDLNLIINKIPLKKDIFKLKLLQDVCKRIIDNPSNKIELIDLLIKKQEYQQLNILNNEKYNNSLKEYVDEIIKKREILESIQNVTNHEKEKIDNYIIFEHYSLANNLLDNFLKKESEQCKKNKDDILSWARKERQFIRNKTDDLEIEDTEYFKTIEERSNNLNKVIALLIRDKESNNINLLKELIDLFKNILKEKTSYFSEFDKKYHLLSSDNSKDIYLPYQDIKELSEDDKNLRNEIKDKWLHFSNDVQNKTWNINWSHFVQHFAKLSNLLHGQSSEEVKNIKIEESLINGRQTKFKNRHATAFQNDVCLYLLPGLKPNSEEIESLRDYIEHNKTDAFNIIFIPGDIKNLVKRKLQQYEKVFNLVFIDNDFFDKFINEKNPERIFRQLIIKTKSLSSVSPFISSGRVLNKYNIYVGRESSLERLSNNNYSWLSGGRRIGKTSLLHRFDERLARSNKKWNIVFVNAQHITINEDGDELLRKEICNKLGWVDISTIEAFRIKLKSYIEEHHIAILIDEMDRYIKSSNSKYQNEYPLISSIRSVAQDDNKNNLKVVFAGFKELYKVCELQDTRDERFPFKQFLSKINNLKMLETKETEELLTKGFIHTLGVNFDPEVPRIVNDYTGGHPAFIQEFCSRLIDLLDKRHGKNNQYYITKKDIDDVFEESRTIEGEKPFVEFINETLGWNLSKLGRILFIIIASEHGHNTFIKTDITRKLNEYCEIIDDSLEPIPDSLYDEAMVMLVMTGMLIKNSQEKYSVAISSYIKILNRLDNINNKAYLDNLIEKYLIDGESENE